MELRSGHQPLMRAVGNTVLEERTIPRARATTAFSWTPPTMVTLRLGFSGVGDGITRSGVPILDTIRADSHKSCPIYCGLSRATILKYCRSAMRGEVQGKIHTMQHRLYKRFAYAISVSSLGREGGCWTSGMLSKAAIQTCLEDLLVRRLRKALLAHDIRNRSAG